MKKVLLLFISIVTATILFGATTTVTKPELNANHILLPVGKTDKKISLMELSRISIKDFQDLTGQKMNFFDRFQFKIAQKKLRNTLNEDGSFSKKKIEKYFQRAADGEGFQAGGFFLGFLLGLIGVLIAYLIKDDQKRNRVKWAWIGFGIWIGILIIIAAAGGGVY